MSFAGPWVLVEPRDPAADQAPIELRATLERREGDAFALRTSVAGLSSAAFLRPPDWTMLVEEGGLALAMGDEPLTSYPRSPEPPPPLVGPARLDEAALPEEEPTSAETLACLEFAGDRCGRMEGTGPRAAGCREAQWTVCAEHLGPVDVDPTIQAAAVDALTLHADAVALRFAAGLRASELERRSEATAVWLATLGLVIDELDEILERGPLPADDPNLATIAAYLRHARDHVELAEDAFDWAALP